MVISRSLGYNGFTNNLFSDGHHFDNIVLSPGVRSSSPKLHNRMRLRRCFLCSRSKSKNTYFNSCVRSKVTYTYCRGHSSKLMSFYNYTVAASYPASRGTLLAVTNILIIHSKCHFDNKSHHYFIFHTCILYFFLILSIRNTNRVFRGTVMYYDSACCLTFIK